MLWLKRNLDLVAAILVGVILTGLGGWYVWNKKSQSDSLDEELAKAKRELDRLTLEVKPSPNQQNLTACRKDMDEAVRYSEDCRKLFLPTPTDPLTSQTFRSLLENTVAELRRTAAQNSVDLVTNYNFSFEAQIRPVSFQQATLKPMAEQLAEISTICRALFKARVHRLELIRRVAVSEKDSSSAAEILPNVAFQSDKATGMAVWPYEFTFECFSGELAAGLNELRQAPRMLLIKSINVQPSATTSTVAIGNLPDAAAPGTPSGRPAFRGGPRNLPAAPGSAPKTTELKPALTENLLTVTLMIHVVKPDHMVKSEGRPFNR